MCLGVPALILELGDDRGTPMATVDFGGVTRSVCLAYTPDAGVGEYVIVHAGFAIAAIDEAEAQATLRLFEQMGIVEPAGALEPAEAVESGGAGLRSTSPSSPTRPSPAASWPRSSPW